MASKKTLETDPFIPNDPFAEEREERITTALERGTYVSQTLAPKTEEPGYGDNAGIVHGTTSSLPASQPETGLLPYQRAADLTDDLSLHPLEDYQGLDLLVWKFDKWSGAESMGPFMTLEVSLASDPSQGRFLVNCGGGDAMRKIENAFSKSDGPMLVELHKKRLANGNSFWVLS